MCSKQSVCLLYCGECIGEVIQSGNLPNNSRIRKLP